MTDFTSTSMPMLVQQFFDYVQDAWQQQQLQKLIFSQFRHSHDLQKIMMRPIQLKGINKLSATWRYQTKDITKNYDWAEFVAQFDEWQQNFAQANLMTPSHDIQLKFKKNHWQLTHTKIKNKTAAIAKSNDTTAQHDHQKKRLINQNSLYLQLLGITDARQQIIPSMARKWKQINKFIEIFADALQDAHLSSIDEPRALYVADFGAGKGYLTFALYDYLQQHRFLPHVTGIELRKELAEFCQHTARTAQFEHLQFFQGDVRSFKPPRTDVMIALHACDIATDYAIFSGIDLDAKIIMCAPCCHKELRPQLHAPAQLKPLLDFGVHAGQHAEMLTDTIRAMLLSAYGYHCKIIEFVSLEHTSKNKMILAVRHNTVDQPDEEILAQIAALMAFHGIKEHTLQQLLAQKP